MGLQLLEREKTVLKGEKDIQPDFTGKEYLLERQLKPEARKDIIEKLAAANIVPTSMMDISDGLSSELMHICKQSNTGSVSMRNIFLLTIRRLSWQKNST